MGRLFLKVKPPGRATPGMPLVLVVCTELHRVFERMKKAAPDRVRLSKWQLPEISCR